MDKLFYAEYHSTMTDDSHYFSCSDEDRLKASLPLIEKFMFAGHERKYRETLHEIEMNGIKYHSPFFDEAPVGECIKYYEDRF